MGRISKRVHVPGGAGQGKIQGEKYYRAGLYARLSSDQDPKKNESQAGPQSSLETQIHIAEKYIEDWNRHHRDRIEIVGRYVDLGKTGTNFERDAFKRLMQDIRLGDINCVVVKDLSRFGRNYLEAGNYIEKIFPFLGVRFIAVTDGYDTGEEGNSTKQMVSEIKNLVNDMYAKDSSVKSKLSLEQRRAAGSYVGGPPPYGYEAYREGRVRKLKPDRNTVEIVQDIYRKFVETESYQAVANSLNQRRINPPAIYKKTKEVCCPAEMVYKGWDKSAVESILKSETYLGRLVQGRTSLTARKAENRIQKPEEEWVRKENTHEALVSPELYEQAQEIRHRIQERTRSHSHRTEGCPIGENIFQSILYCGVCGRKMTRHSEVRIYADGRRERKDGYFCLDSTGTKRETCPDANHIYETELSGILLILLRTEFATQLKKPKSFTGQMEDMLQQKRKELDRKLKKTEGQISALSEEEGGEYMAYSTGKLSQEEYACYRFRKEERLQELEKLRDQCRKEAEKLEGEGKAYLKAVRSLIKCKSQKELTRELVEELVERIYVYPGRRVEVVFHYRDIMRGEA